MFKAQEPPRIRRGWIGDGITFERKRERGEKESNTTEERERIERRQERKTPKENSKAKDNKELQGRQGMRYLYGWNGRGSREVRVSFVFTFVFCLFAIVLLL